MAIKENFLVGQQSLSSSTFKLQLSCVWILMISCIDRSVIGMLTLSPMMVAPVCRVGDPLQITCTAPVEFIRWSIVVVNGQGMEEEITVSRNSRDPNPQPKERIINSTTFIFTRTSAEGDSPLISTLSINSVSISLNGTVVRCMDANNPMTSNSTTIHIIDTINDLQLPTLLITSEVYEANNVTVTVEWDQQEGAIYTVRVLPPVPIVLSGSTSHQLTIPYNSEYNLTVEASVLCQPNAMAFIRLNYASCGHPGIFLRRVDDDPILRVVGYDVLPVQGSTITFSCLPGFMLTGPNSATCTENGEWEFDSNRPTCTNVSCGHPLSDRVSLINNPIIVMGYMDPAMEGTTVTFRCPPEHTLIGPITTSCMGNGEWEPDPGEVECQGNIKSEQSLTRSTDALSVAVSTTVIISLVISLLTFIAGFVCGHYIGARKKSPKKTPVVPLYEPVDVLASTVEHQEKDLELEENVAYGPSKPITVDQ